MYYCGIDWAVEKLDFCVIDDNEQKTLAFSVENNYNGYKQALNLIQELEDFCDIKFAIEDKHQHVVSFIIKEGFSVFCVNPNNIYNHRKSVSISGCRSDSVDAYLIARYLKSNSALLTPIRKESKKTEQRSAGEAFTSQNSMC